MSTPAASLALAPPLPPLALASPVVLGEALDRLPGKIEEASEIADQKHASVKTLQRLHVLSLGGQQAALRRRISLHACRAVLSCTPRPQAQHATCSPAAAPAAGGAAAAVEGEGAQAVDGRVGLHRLRAPRLLLQGARLPPARQYRLRGRGHESECRSTSRNVSSLMCGAGRRPIGAPGPACVHSLNESGTSRPFACLVAGVRAWVCTLSLMLLKSFRRVGAQGTDWRPDMCIRV
jgi:hypothetical protein